MQGRTDITLINEEYVLQLLSVFIIGDYELFIKHIFKGKYFFKKFVPADVYNKIRFDNNY